MVLCCGKSALDTMCNCCGCCGTCCCPIGRERCCDCLNHCCCFGPMCCEMCPCGADGCIGYPNHLCGCCGNCNLMCYAGSCTPCFVADMYIASDFPGQEDADKAGTWSSIMCTFILLQILGSILSNRAIPGGPIIANIINLIYYVTLTVVFGVAATKIAKKQGFDYEPQDCCTSCWDQGIAGCPGNCMKCCTSWQCCCAYCCCMENHMLQVARAMEGSQEMQQNIMNGRPQQCKCCNCWETAKPLELTTSATANV